MFAIIKIEKAFGIFKFGKKIWTKICLVENINEERLRQEINKQLKENFGI